MTQPAHTAAALRRSPHASTSSAVRTSLSRSVLAVGILAGALSSAMEGSPQPRLRTP